MRLAQPKLSTKKTVSAPVRQWDHSRRNKSGVYKFHSTAVCFVVLPKHFQLNSSSAHGSLLPAFRLSCLCCFGPFDATRTYGTPQSRFTACRLVRTPSRTTNQTAVSEIYKRYFCFPSRVVPLGQKQFFEKFGLCQPHRTLTKPKLRVQ